MGGGHLSCGHKPVEPVPPSPKLEGALSSFQRVAWLRHTTSVLAGKGHGDGSGTQGLAGVGTSLLPSPRPPVEADCHRTAGGWQCPHSSQSQMGHYQQHCWRTLRP